MIKRWMGEIKHIEAIEKLMEWSRKKNEQQISNLISNTLSLQERLEALDKKLEKMQNSIDCEVMKYKDLLLHPLKANTENKND